MDNQPASQYTTALILPFKFDTGKLQAELNHLLSSQWRPHINLRGYEGDWNTLALYAKDGDPNKVFSWNHKDAELKETPFLQQCPYIKAVIQQFKCPLISARLLRLCPGAYIKPHCDHELGYENNNFRLHIPISTNPQVEFILDGQLLKMMPGECWYTNVNYEHAVANKGTTDRVHLVIDCERNDWSDQLFFSLAPKSSFFPVKETNYSPETIKAIIEGLKLQNLPANQQLIENLQKQLTQ